MSLTSPLFFAFLATVVVAYNISASVPYRRTVLGLANAIFIGSYLTDAIQALPLFAFLLLGYFWVGFSKSGNQHSLCGWVLERAGLLRLPETVLVLR